MLKKELKLVDSASGSALKWKDCFPALRGKSMQKYRSGPFPLLASEPVLRSSLGQMAGTHTQRVAGLASLAFSVV